MIELYYNDEERLKQINDNVLAQFICEAADQFQKGNYAYRYAQPALTYMEQFGKWVKSRNIPICTIDEQHIKSYFSSRNRVLKRAVKALKCNRLTAIRMLVRIIREKHPLSKTPIQCEVDRYAAYSREVRGLAESTVAYHAKVLYEFLVAFFAKKQISPGTLTPLQVRRYAEKIPTTKSNGKRKNTYSVLRSYFRFLQMNDGIVANNVIAAIPLVARDRYALKQRIVTENEQRKLLNSVKRNAPIEKRSYAVLLCLCDLAMRIGDVSRLSLDDIDWRKGTILIGNHKGKAPFRVPLPQRVGEAIADYIKSARPSSSSRRVFLTHGHSHCKEAAEVTTLQRGMDRLWAQSGLPDELSGTHILRHSTATNLRCKGMSLKVIADLLGHQSIECTAIYAQVDEPSLRLVAQPWPKIGGVK